MGFDDTEMVTYRSDAEVQWNNNDHYTQEYCVGREGISELKCVEEADGCNYYENHLPTVTKGRVNHWPYCSTVLSFLFPQMRNSLFSSFFLSSESNNLLEFI